MRAMTKLRLPRGASVAEQDFKRLDQNSLATCDLVTPRRKLRRHILVVISQELVNVRVAIGRKRA